MKNGRYITNDGRIDGRVGFTVKNGKYNYDQWGDKNRWPTITKGYENWWETNNTIHLSFKQYSEQCSS